MKKYFFILILLFGLYLLSNKKNGHLSFSENKDKIVITEPYENEIGINNKRENDITESKVKDLINNYRKYDKAIFVVGNPGFFFYF